MHSVISNIRVAGIAAAVPKTVYQTVDSPYGSESDRVSFQQVTGIYARRVADKQCCTSDYAYEAARRLIEELGWKKQEIEVLIFVTQSPDYIMPSTAIILQDRLGLPKTCTAFDINLGCSGYVIGMQVIAGLLKLTPGKKALLLVGDTMGRESVSKKEAAPLFGDAGTATAFEYSEETADLYIDSRNDGAGYDKIICEYGAYRQMLTEENIQFNENGELEIDWGYKMDGHGVFNFACGVVPNAVRTLLTETDHTLDHIDYYIFHQANKQINELLRKNLKISPEKFPYSISEFGNTSSATIPLTIVANLRNVFKKDETYRLLMCGFGIGLSWGTAIASFKNVHIPELIEI